MPVCRCFSALARSRVCTLSWPQGPLRTGSERASSPGCFVFDVRLICILKATGGRVGFITMTDSVYVSVGAVKVRRLDKGSDRLGKIYGWSWGGGG